MNTTQSLRQAQAVSIVVAALLAGSAYVMHPMLHYAIAPDPTITAGATLALTLIAFAFRHAALRLFSGGPLICDTPTASENSRHAPTCFQAATDIERETRLLRLLIEILCRQLQNSSDTGETAAIHLAKDLIEIDKALSGQRDAPLTLLPEARTRIGEQLADALTRIQFQDTVQQQIACVIQALEQLDAYTAQLATGLLRTDPDRIAQLPPVARLLDNLYDSYISAQQRSIHDASLRRSTVPSTAPRTELF